MKQTTKVTLLSLLVFPGVGHLALKQYTVAAGFIISFTYLLFGFIQDIYTITQEVVDNVVQGKIPMDATAIQQALIDQRALDNPNLSTVSYILLALWLAAALDAFRIAHNNQKKHKNSNSENNV